MRIAHLLLFICLLSAGAIPCAAETDSYSTPLQAVQPSDISLPVPSSANRVSFEDYPGPSRRLGEQGVAVVAVLINADGSVGDAKIEKSSGSPRLDKAAVQIVKTKYRYSPAKKDGQPIAVWMGQPVVFDLAGNSAGVDCMKSSCKNDFSQRMGPGMMP